MNTRSVDGNERTEQPEPEFPDDAPSVGGPACRFEHYHGEWVAMAANVDAPTLERSAPDDRDAIVVPNLLAACAPEMLDALLEARDQIVYLRGRLTPEQKRFTTHTTSRVLGQIEAVLEAVGEGL